MAPSLFISYSPRDAAQFDKLEAHLLPLQRRGQLTYWHAGMTAAGTEWQKYRSARMAQAQLLICLVSADYLAGMDDELTEIFQQKARGATIVPVLVRPAMLGGSPLGALKALPSNGRSISQWSAQEDAWLDVAQGLWALTEAAASQVPGAGAGHPGSTDPGSIAPAAPPSSRKVRNLLEAVLRTDADFEAFCLDFFPSVKRAFTIGMERGQKVNLLLEKAELPDILRALAEAEPALYARHRQLLA